MARITERYDSREAVVGPESPRRILRYTVLDASDEATAGALVQATIPAFYDGLAFQSFSLRPVGGDVWDIEVEYSPRKQDGRDSPTAGSGGPSDGTGSGGDGSGSDGGDGGRTPKQPGDGPQDARDWDFSFDTGGGSAKIFVFRAKSVNGGFPVTTARTLWKGPGNANKADFGGAINVRQQGTKEVAEGVEIAVPQFSFTLKGRFLPPLPSNFIKRLYQLTAHVNTDKVVIYAHGASLSFLAGELLFRNGTGGLRRDGEVELLLNFVASENAMINGVIDNAQDNNGANLTGLEKKGHEYAWFRFQDEVNNAQLVPKPVQLFVGEVYPTAALAPLLTPFK